jgi:hypothetical protein
VAEVENVGSQFLSLRQDRPQPVVKSYICSLLTF